MLSEPTFQSLAAQLGLSAPEMLVRLIEDGKTRYGSTHAEWRSSWRERLLNNPPALASCYDLEWIDAATSSEEMVAWLNTEVQYGFVFLPFAQNGAGDAYCLVAKAGAVDWLGVTMMEHDGSNFLVTATCFEDFVYTRLLENLADFDHLKSDIFSVQEAHQAVLADLRTMLPYFPPERAARIQGFAARPLMYSEVLYGKRLETVPSVISQLEFETEMAFVKTIASDRFPMRARWEVPGAEDVLPEPTWQELALQEGERKAAIQLCKSVMKTGTADAMRIVTTFLIKYAEDPTQFQALNLSIHLRLRLSGIKH